MADRTLRVIFAGDASRAIAASRGLQANLKRVGAGLTSAGRTMTRNVTIPIVAAGAASLKLATDFETAFTKIDAVSNASQEELKKWRSDVLKLAGQTARAPEELADALYVLASAGLKANQVIPTLEVSAKAAAIGLGETKDIARLTANALNAYAKDGLTAAQATDTLIAAVKEGTADPTEFASALGRILPIAAKAGVSFDEVTASLASLSNIGLDVNEGVTAMRGLLSALEAPTKMAKDAMADLGITTEELRDRISKRGVLDAMRFLEKATGGNIDKLRELVPNIRALTGLFGITGQEADKVTASFQRVTDSTGSMDKAFAETKKGSAFKFAQLMSKLKKLAIEIGNLLLPFARKAVKEIGKLVKQFSDLSPATQKTIIKFAALAVVLGPIVSVVGGLVKTLGVLVGIFGGAVTAAIAVNVAIAALAAKFKWFREVVAFVFKSAAASVSVLLAPILATIDAAQRLVDVLKQIPNAIGQTNSGVTWGDIPGGSSGSAGSSNNTSGPGPMGRGISTGTRSGLTINVYADSVTDGKKLARFVREEWNRAEKEQARRHRGMPQPVTA